MNSLEDLLDTEDTIDPELIPEIVPIDARLSIKGNVDSLLEVFERAGAITPIKEIIAGTSYNLLEAVAPTGNTEGYINLTATDGEQTIKMLQSGLTVLIAGSVLLPGRKILEILKHCGSEKFSLEILGDTATIRSGRAVWRVQTPLTDYLPPVPDISSIALSEVPTADLLTGLLRVQKAISITSARPGLMQAKIEDGSILSCDGARLHKATVEGLSKNLEFSMPLKVVLEVIRELKKCKRENVKLGSDGRYMVFDFGSDTLIAQRLLIDFPSVEKLLMAPSLSNSYLLSVDREELSESIKRIRVNANPDIAAIYLAITPGKADDFGNSTWYLAVKANDRQGNAAQELLNVQWSGVKGKEICINHRYLLDLLDSYREDIVAFKLGDDSKSVKSPLFVNDKDHGFTGIIQQMNA